MARFIRFKKQIQIIYTWRRDYNTGHTGGARIHFIIQLSVERCPNLLQSSYNSRKWRSTVPFRIGIGRSPWDSSAF